MVKNTDIKPTTMYGAIISSTVVCGIKGLSS
jgi:hypothetical protein